MMYAKLVRLRCYLDHFRAMFLTRPTSNTTAGCADSAELKDLFGQIDADGDGGIDNHEMTSALSEMGILGPELQTIARSKVNMLGFVSSSVVNQMFLEADHNR